MKSIDWLSLTRLRLSRVLYCIALVAFTFACSDDSSDVAPGADASARKDKSVSSSTSGNSETPKDGYCIAVVVEGTTWTYTITRKPGAKGISHFILDLNNCELNQTLSIESILWATVNGKPATISNSEGKGTGCVLNTDNFVKFDDLEDASTYVIVFELDAEYGNSSEGTAWIKAGTSCHQYEVAAPCCI